MPPNAERFLTGVALIRWFSHMFQEVRRLAKQADTTDRTSPIYVICGPEEFLRRQALARVRHDVLGADPDPMACSEFEPAVRLGEVLDELRTLPLLAERRLVVVADADAFIKQHREALERYCGSPSACGTLLLVCRTFDKRTRLYKAVAKVGTILSCELEKRTDVAGWIVSQARAAYGKHVDRRAAQLLNRLVGDDLAMLDSELSKLAIYVGSRSMVSADDVDALVGRHREEKVFDIAISLVRGDGARALNAWAQAWVTERSAQPRAVGGLAWALRRNLEGKISLRQGAPIGQVARMFWKRPDEVRDLLEHASITQLEEHLLALLRCDVGIKVGAHASLQVPLENLIVTHCN